MRNITTILGALVIAGCGCSHTPIREMALIRVLRIPEYQVFETHDANVICDVKGWLSDVKPRQLPSKQLGSVVPYCEVLIYQLQGHQRNLISSNSIYAIDGAKTERSLLADEEIDRLDKILGRISNR
jgi:hypothetical protein